MNPFAIDSGALPTGRSTAVLPVSSAPDVNVPALKLAEINRKALEAKGMGVDEKPIENAMSAVDTVLSGFDKADERKRAAEMEKVLQAGWPAYQNAWVAAGSPPDGDPSLLMTGDPKLDGGPNGNLVAGYKIITGWKDKSSREAGRASASELAAGGADETQIVNALDKSEKTPELIISGAKSKATRDAKVVADKLKSDTAIDVQTMKGNIAKSLAGLKAALKNTKDAGLVAAIEKDSKELEDKNTELETAEAKLAGIDALMDESKFRTQAAAVARIKSEVSKIDARVSAYTSRLSDPSKVTTTPKVAPPDTLDPLRILKK